MATKSFIKTITCILLLAACGKESDEVGGGEPIIEGKRKFTVRAEGEKLNIKLKNTFWYNWSQRYTLLDTIDIVPLYDTTNTVHWYTDTLTCENLTIWGEEKRLKVDIGPNDLTLEKCFSFGLQHGDRFEGLCIIQEARKE